MTKEGTMNNTIWKFELLASESFFLKMPKGATILDVQVQHGKPYIWVLVNPSVEKEDRLFGVFGTGHVVPATVPTAAYLGTFQLEDGALVFHLFERVISCGDTPYGCLGECRCILPPNHSQFVKHTDGRTHW